jgi:hypothetical protein
MIIEAVESKLEDFFETGSFSSASIIKKRFASLMHNQSKDYRKEVFLDKNGIFRQTHRVCINPDCDSTDIQWNGYHECKSFILKEIGLSFKVGQFKCCDCGLRWSINTDEIYAFLEQVKEQIRLLAVGIKSNKNSLFKTSKLVEIAIGKKYSHMSVSRWYKSRTATMQEKEIPKEDYSGYYVYDEQEVRAGGKKIQRLTLRDLKIRQPVAEELAPDKSKESIQCFLVKSLKDKPRKAMVVDGDHSYPAIITSDLHMDYQLDICHLFENIRKAFKDDCAYGVGHKKLHLADELKKQELFDVFYPRPALITFIKDGLKKLEAVHDKTKKEMLDMELQKELLKLKLERKKLRRRKAYVSEHKSYTIDQAKKKFDFVRSLYQYYPASAQKLIHRIEDDWKHYTLFLIDRNVPPTSNYIEQYYSSTLQWSEKKKFRNKEQLDDFIRLERLKKAGVFSELLNQTGLNFIEIIGAFILTFLGV